MNTYDYSLLDVLENPKRLKSIDVKTIIDKFLLEVLTEKQNLFLSFIQKLIMYRRDVYSVLCYGSKRSVYPFYELFKNERELLRDFPKYEYGSVSGYKFFDDMINQYKNGLLNNEEQRKRIIYTAQDTLSADDYALFVHMILQDIPDEFVELLNVDSTPFKYRNFILDYHLNCDIFKTPDNLFSNNTNTEYYYEANTIKQFIQHGYYSYEIENDQKKLIQDTSDYAFLSRSYTEEPIMVIMADNQIIAVEEVNKLKLASNKFTQINEISFTSRLCEDFTKSFVFVKNNTVTGVVNNKTCKVHDIKIDSFTVTPVPFGANKIALLTCIQGDSEIHLFVSKSLADSFGKNKKKFSFVELNTNKYVV